MATKVLSMEVGVGLTRVVEMDYKTKNPKIYNCFTFETPQGVVNDGMVTRNETFASLLKAGLDERNIKTNKVVYSVTSSRIANRKVKIPQVKDKQIQSILDSNASDFFPVDMTQYHLTYSGVEKIEEAGKKKLRVNVFAVPNELTSGYFDFAQSCGLQLMAVDYVGNSVYQVVKDSFPNGVTAVVKIDEPNTLITFIKDGQVVLQRTIAYGVEDTIRTVQGAKVWGENISYAGAINILSGKTCIRRFLNPEEDYKEKEDTDKNITEARIAVTDSLRFLVGNLARVMEYYVSHNDGDTIDKVSVIGLGATFSGLSKLLDNELSIKTRVYQNIENASLGKTIADENLNLSAYLACIGAGIAPLNLIPEQIGKAARGAKKEKASGGDTAFIVGIIVGVAAFIVAAGLAGMSILKYNTLQSEKKSLESEISQLREEGVEQVYIEYTTVTGLNERLNTIYDSTRTRSEELVAFIEELENKMPSDLIVLNFTATDAGVTMTIECDSKESAAKTLLQLRTFESIQIVSSAGLTDDNDLLHQADEDGVVAFTVDCTYKPVQLNEEEVQ